MSTLASGLRLAPRAYRRVSARPAQFDASAQQKRLLIAKLKLAVKQLNMADDDYRQILLRITGFTSSTKCSVPQLVQVVEELKAKGFQAKPTKRIAKAADHPSARKARAMWISLYHLGAIGNSSEAALETFARRQLGVEQLQWADQQQCYKLVEALKAMAERHGWSQNLVGVSAASAVAVLKHRLCDAILAKLQAEQCVPAEWRLEDAAFRLAGLRPEGAGPIFWQLGDYERVAAALGAALRECGVIR